MITEVAGFRSLIKRAVFARAASMAALMLVFLSAVTGAGHAGPLAQLDFCSVLPTTDVDFTSSSADLPLCQVIDKRVPPKYTFIHITKYPNVTEAHQRVDALAAPQQSLGETKAPLGIGDAGYSWEIQRPPAGE